jgi:hypothetical protein
MLPPVGVSGDLEIQRAGCYLCGRPTFDPEKRERPWARAVSGGKQVLVCPSCQETREDWSAALDRCQRCGATRLSAMLGEVVCRACGLVQSEGRLEPEEF